jgi:hypothetical protein
LRWWRSSVALAAVRGKVAGSNSLADRWGMVAMMALDTQFRCRDCCSTSWLART